MALRALRLWLAPWALVLIAARSGAPELHVGSQGDPHWRSGQPVAVAVHEGRSRFQIPARTDGGDTLVVVSSLADRAGPFAVELEAAPAAIAEPPQPVRLKPPGRAGLRPHRPETIPAPPAVLPPTRRDFHMMVRDGDVTVASNYLTVHGVLRAVGRNVQVYVSDEDRDQVDRALLEDVVAAFDTRVLPAAARAVGLATDVDRDGRFTVLLSGWLSRLGNGRNPVDGFVRVTDLDPTFAQPFGNRCDMMYLSTSLKPGPHLRTVIAHEYMHAVVFSKKQRRDGGPRPLVVEEEGWLDEALAHLFEDLVGFSRSNIDYRVDAFLAQPERYQLVVDDYYAADLFRSHGHRGSTYLFLRWCVDQYGPDLLPTLVHSRLRGVANVEGATGCSFDDLYRRWSVALYLGGIEPGMRPGSTQAGTAPGADPAADWPFVGPRPRLLEPGGRPDRWEAAGTSSHYALIPGRAAGPVEVTIAGPPGADLQVTAVPLPADLGRLELTVRPVAGPGDEPQFEAVARRSDGRQVVLRSLAWGPLVPPADPRSPAQVRGRLEARDLAESLGAATISGGGMLHSRPIALADVQSASGPLVVKLVATDDLGRRLTGWAVLGGPGVRALRREGRPLATRTP